jgi:hypothetical protein
MFYDMEFDADLKIKASDKSFVFINWEMHDENWEATPGDSNSKTGDDNIAIKRAYGSYTFDFGTQLDFGLMTGAAWANDWANTADGRYRLKFVHPTAAGPVFFILEKNLENGEESTADDDREADDSDAYYLAMVTKLGDLKVMPLLGYVLTGEVGAGNLEPEGADQVTMFIDLGVDGSFGALGFSSEFVYQNISLEFDGADPDSFSLYGAFVDVWANLDALKVGGILAYGSFDDDAGAGFGFGEDFCPTIFGADWTAFGATAKSEYNAVTFGQVYAGFALSETMDITGAFAYFMSNSKDNFWEDATGMELDLFFDWKLADNVKWSAALGYGQWNLDEDAAGYDDADAFTRFYHVIKVSF